MNPRLALALAVRRRFECPTEGVPDANVVRAPRNRAGPLTSGVLVVYLGWVAQG